MTTIEAKNPYWKNIGYVSRTFFHFSQIWIQNITLYPASTLRAANVPITSSASTPGTCL